MIEVMAYRTKPTGYKSRNQMKAAVIYKPACECTLIPAEEITAFLLKHKNPE